MRKKSIIIFTIILILIGILVFLLSNSITGEAIKYQPYSHTKAICNETHCRDYLIVCEENDIISKTPITGFISHGPEWKDPRDEETINKLCS